MPGCNCGCCCAGKKRGMMKYANAETPIAVNNDVISAVFRTEFFMACVLLCLLLTQEKSISCAKILIVENKCLPSCRSPEKKGNFYRASAAGVQLYNCGK